MQRNSRHKYIDPKLQQEKTGVQAIHSITLVLVDFQWEIDSSQIALMDLETRAHSR